MASERQRLGDFEIVHEIGRGSGCFILSGTS